MACPFPFMWSWVAIGDMLYSYCDRRCTGDVRYRWDALLRHQICRCWLRLITARPPLKPSGISAYYAWYSVANVSRSARRPTTPIRSVLYTSLPKMLLRATCNLSFSRSLTGGLSEALRRKCRGTSGVPGPLVAPVAPDAEDGDAQGLKKLDDLLKPGARLCRVCDLGREPWPILSLGE